VDEIYAYALKLLRVRDYTVARLREKVEAKFGSAPEEVIQQLLKKNFLNDRRFAENYVLSRGDRSLQFLREDLVACGVASNLAEEVLSQREQPSLSESLAAKMKIWRLRAPLKSRDAARLFRALVRLGYDEDAIREEIEQLNAQ
jgi:SOS response regulatory protein OraA/RecX